MKWIHFKSLWKVFSAHFFIALLVILLLVVAFFLGRHIGAAGRAGVFSRYRSPSEFFLHHKPIAQGSGSIQGWMTFGYIEFLFHTSPNYIQSALHIDDPKYPNVTVAKYAKTKKLDVNVLLGQIKDVIDKSAQKPVTAPK